MTRPHTARKVRRFYQFIELHQEQYAVKTMCRLLKVTRSGYYAWLKEPISNRAQEDARLLRLIRASFVASNGIYGAPRVFLDLREAGETCSKHRVARLMRINGIRAAYGYGARRHSATKPSALIPNSLQRNFTVSKPNTAWVTDITYIRTWQGWLYLAVVMDLFSRKIVGWSTRPTIATCSSVNRDFFIASPSPQEPKKRPYSSSKLPRISGTTSDVSGRERSVGRVPLATRTGPSKYRIAAVRRRRNRRATQCFGCGAPTCTPISSHEWELQPHQASADQVVTG